MTAEGWREAVMRASHDAVLFDLLVALLTEQDAAKEALRVKGYGVTGTPWREVVQEVPAMTEIGWR